MREREGEPGERVTRQQRQGGEEGTCSVQWRGKGDRQRLDEAEEEEAEMENAGEIVVGDVDGTKMWTKGTGRCDLPVFCEWDNKESGTRMEREASRLSGEKCQDGMRREAYSRCNGSKQAGRLGGATGRGGWAKGEATAGTAA